MTEKEKFLGKKIIDIANKLSRNPLPKRRNIIRQLLKEEKLKFHEQEVNSNGINFIISDFSADKDLILISSHYDGPGMYDNAVGSIITIFLAKYFKKNRKLCFVLFDLEEQHCQGSITFFNKLKDFLFHYDIGGCGTGNILFAKNPATPICFNSSNKKIFLPFITDSIQSYKNGILSSHLFFLDEKDSERLNNHICPLIFFKLHTKNDDCKIVDYKTIFFNYKMLQLILKKSITLDYITFSFLEKYGVNLL